MRPILPAHRIQRLQYPFSRLYTVPSSHRPFKTSYHHVPQIRYGLHRFRLRRPHRLRCSGGSDIASMSESTAYTKLYMSLTPLSSL